MIKSFWVFLELWAIIAILRGSMRSFVQWLTVLCMLAGLHAGTFARGCDEGWCDDSGACKQLVTDGHQDGEGDHSCACDDDNGCHCNCHFIHMPVLSLMSTGFVIAGCSVEMPRHEGERLPEEPVLGSEKPPLI